MSICFFWPKYNIFVEGYFSLLILYQTALLCTLSAQKGARFSPLFTKSCSKNYSLYTGVDLFYFGPRKLYFRKLFFLLILYQRHHCAHFQAQKSASFRCYFEKLLQKVQSIDCLDLFTLVQELFCFEDISFVDSLSEHHCAHFRPKKGPVFQFFRNVAPKSTVYRLSRFVLFGPRTFFFRRPFFC